MLLGQQAGRFTGFSRIGVCIHIRLTDSIAEPLDACASCYQGYELTSLNDAIVLIDQLSKPSDSASATSMSRGFDDGGHNMNDIAKKYGGFETPFGDADQSQCRHAGALAGQPGQYAQSKQPVCDRFAKG